MQDLHVVFVLTPGIILSAFLSESILTVIYPNNHNNDDDDGDDDDDNDNDDDGEWNHVAVKWMNVCILNIHYFFKRLQN